MLEFIIDGTAYSNITSYEVMKSIDSVVARCRISIVDTFIINKKPIPFNFNTRIKINYIDESNTKRLFFTGFLENKSILFNVSKSTINLEFISDAGDFIISTLDGKEYNKQSLKSIADAILKPFDLKTDFGSSPIPSISFSFDDGTSGIDILRRLAVQGKYLIFPDVNNVLLFRKRSSSNSKTITDSDIIEITLDEQYNNLFKEYKIKSKDVKGDYTDTYTVKLLDRNRTKIIPDELTDGSVKRADFLAKIDIAKRFILNIVVKDIRFDLRVNLLLPLRSSLFNINDTFLISEISYSYTDNKPVTKLTCVLKEAYD